MHKRATLWTLTGIGIIALALGLGIWFAKATTPVKPSPENPPLPSPATSTSIPPADMKLDFGDGMVLDPQGHPLAGATVWEVEPGENVLFQISRGQVTNQVRDLPSARTDKNGIFTVPHPSPDFTLVILEDAGYARLDQTAFQQNPRITLDKWTRLEVTVLQGGKPVPGANFLVEYKNWQHPLGENGPDIMAAEYPSADAQGKFILPRAFAGPVRAGQRTNVPDVGLLDQFGQPLTTFVIQGSHYTPWLDAKPGQTLRLDINMDPDKPGP